ncbi:MAG TPA: phage tail protein [Burkholderiaceae bacterium]|nr:phage tail protein [Burkholderiaceae bacterium]
MVSFTIRTNFPEVQAKLQRLQSDVGAAALASAINKTLAQGKTQMVRAITAEFNVKAAYVRDRLRIRRATARGGTALIEGALMGGKSDRTRSANIIAFVERKVTLAEGRRRRKAGTLNQLFVKVKRTGPVKPIPGAFIGNKGRTVFKRVGKTRLPIEPVQTIDVAQMFNTKRINIEVRKVMLAKFPTVFAREAAFYTERFNRQAINAAFDKLREVRASGGA